MKATLILASAIMGTNSVHLKTKDYFTGGEVFNVQITD